MYNLLLKLMLISAMIQFGITATDLVKLGSKGTRDKVERASRDVLKMTWKPISVFPEEAQRIKEHYQKPE